LPTLPLCGACLVLTVLAQEEPAAAPPLELRDHARLSSELERLAAAHPDLVELHRLGESRGGRAIDALRLAGAGAAGDPGRPAILLVANVDGARVYSSAVALEHARALADGYEKDAKVRALLDTTTVFVVPRANPDAAEARFATPRFEQHASGPGVDDDRDGRQGEDPPADVDGDGVVTWIRVQDPDGEWRLDENDERAMAKADRVKGERGAYVLWPEGRDTDGDERVAEDAPLDARVDRNFAAGWEQHTPEAGVFPTDEPETRALCEFVLAHPEISLVVLYDAQDTLVGEVKSVGDDAPAVKRIPPTGVLESDAKLLGELGKRYREATGTKAKAEGGDGGTFGRWCYEHRGLTTLATTLWDIPLEEPDKSGEKVGEKSEGDESDKGGEEGGAAGAQAAAESQAPPRGGGGGGAGGRRGFRGGRGGGGPPSASAPRKDDTARFADDARRLKWIDAAGPEEAWRFVAWKAFQHPELGAVEIGGLAPYARLEPPAAESGTIARAHLDWFLTLGELLPRLRVAECTRERLGEGVVRVTAVVENDSYLPLLSRSAMRTRTIRPAKVTLRLPEAGRRLAGDARELLEDLPGSGGRHEYTWLVQGPAEMEIAVAVESTHAGTATAMAQEKQEKQEKK